MQGLDATGSGGFATARHWKRADTTLGGTELAISSKCSQPGPSWHAATGQEGTEPELRLESVSFFRLVRGYYGGGGGGGHDRHSLTWLELTDITDGGRDRSLLLLLSSV